MAHLRRLVRLVAFLGYIRKLGSDRATHRLFSSNASRKGVLPIWFQACEDPPKLNKSAYGMLATCSGVQDARVYVSEAVLATPRASAASSSAQHHPHSFHVRWASLRP